MMRLIAVLMITIFLSCCAPNEFMLYLEKSVPWRSNVTYSLGEYAKEGDGVYQSLQDRNRGNDPELSPDWWGK
jgi:hypothetical protein